MKKTLQITALSVVLLLILVLGMTGHAQTSDRTTPAAPETVDVVTETLAILEPSAPSSEITTTLAVTTTEPVTDTMPVTTTTAVTPTLLPLEPITRVISLPVLSVVTPTVSVTSETNAEPTGETPAATQDSEPVERPSADEEPPLELTVYNSNRGLVKEIRTLDLDEGENSVRFVDVPTSIDPTSVHVVSLDAPTSTTVLEQNYEYDLVSTDKLLAKYIDREIGVRTENGTVYTGTLLSGTGNVILDTSEGIRVVQISQIQEFAFPRLPEGLITRPSLVWLMTSERSGPQRVRVTYLTHGISWNANYTVMLAQEDVAELTGWVTLDNRSGATYDNARLKLIAGDVNVVPEPRLMMSAVDEETRAKTEPAVSERSFFEYHLYEVARPVTVRDRQTKQIEFLAAPSVVAKRTYIYDASPNLYVGSDMANTSAHFGRASGTDIQVHLEMINDAESGLGMPLPNGVVRVYQADTDGGAQLVGEDRIDHTATDEEVDLVLGTAFDVVGERSQISFRQLGERSLEETWSIALKNHKETDIVVKVIERLFRAEDAEIVSASQEYTLTDARTADFDVEVPANDRATVTYSVVYRW